MCIIVYEMATSENVIRKWNSFANIVTNCFRTQIIFQKTLKFFQMISRIPGIAKMIMSLDTICQSPQISNIKFYI